MSIGELRKVMLADLRNDLDLLSSFGESLGRLCTAIESSEEPDSQGIVKDCGGSTLFVMVPFVKALHAAFRKSESLVAAPHEHASTSSIDRRNASQIAS